MAARGEVLAAPAPPAGEVLAASAGEVLGEGRDHGSDEPYPIWLAAMRSFFSLAVLEIYLVYVYLVVYDL